MKFFKSRLDRFEELIKQGDIQGAISRMSNYLHHGLQARSKLSSLFSEIQTFDTNMNFAINQLKKGDTKSALSNIDDLKKRLPRIQVLARDVANEEKEL